MEQSTLNNVVEEARDALKNGETEKALQLAREGLKYELTQGHQAELNRVAAEALCRKGELKRARAYAEEARIHARAAGDYRIICGAAIALGHVFFRMNDYAAADRAWSEALTIARMNDDTRLQCPPLLNMAQLDQRRGNHVRALDVLRKVCIRLEKIKEQRMLGVCYSRMAFSYMEDGKTQDALASVKQLEKLAEQKNDKNLKASAHFRRGSIYLKRNKFSKALPALQKAEELFGELEDTKNRALVTCDLALVHINLKKTRKANSLLNEAVVLAKKVESDGILCKINVLLADKTVFSGPWKKARGFYEEALTKAEAINNEDWFRYLHESLRKTVKKKGFKLAGLKGLLERVQKSHVRLGLKREAEETRRWAKRISLAD